MKVGILGAGGIARVMARTIIGMNNKDVELYAVASRDQGRADEFVKEFPVIKKAYGSYQALAEDKDVDLIYIATPHSEHYANAKMCIECKKALLVEKAFTANYDEAREVLELGKKAGVLVTEAIWTRYMPSRKLIDEAIASGTIGKVHAVRANLCYPINHKDRIKLPELAGGALLDIGIYAINFAMMCFGHKIKGINGYCTLNELGVDMVDDMFLEFDDGKTAQLYANAHVASDRNGYIYGDNGYIVVTNINNPEAIEIFDKNHQKIKDIAIPKQVTGYEYQVLECKEMLEQGKLECPSMPHQHTLEVMQVLDTLRKIYRVRYPFEK